MGLQLPLLRLLQEVSFQSLEGPPIRHHEEDEHQGEYIFLGSLGTPQFLPTLLWPHLLQPHQQM
uniref:Uncharacterized protein n=1 Tax=Arundo donax TaxID=35708 RepID=A0A0A9CMQ3_ARUDO